MGEVEHAAAIRAALEVPLGVWSAYDYDDVPDVLPNLYVLITVSRRFGGQPRMCGGRTVHGWRLTTLAVGRTTDEARFIRDATSVALADRTVTVGGVVSTPIRFETEQPIAPDGGRQSGLTAWTYAL